MGITSNNFWSILEQEVWLDQSARFGFCIHVSYYNWCRCFLLIDISCMVFKGEITGDFSTLNVWGVMNEMQSHIKLRLKFPQ